MTRGALVAGVGNVFFGDDGFGVEVARRLAAAALPPGVSVEDFGVRGLHLAYRLADGLDLLVVVDVAARGGVPGTLYVIEPDLAEPGADGAQGHGMSLPEVFATVTLLGGSLPSRVLLVACEPADVAERLGLSPPVAAAVPAAVALVREVLFRELDTAAVPAAREAVR